MSIGQILDSSDLMLCINLVLFHLGLEISNDKLTQKNEFDISHNLRVLETY